MSFWFVNTNPVALKDNYRVFKDYNLELEEVTDDDLRKGVHLPFYGRVHAVEFDGDGAAHITSNNGGSVVRRRMSTNPTPGVAIGTTKEKAIKLVLSEYARALKLAAENLKETKIIYDAQLKINKDLKAALL